MVKLGMSYINIFKKTFFHPFINQALGYKQLSQDRQVYSNKVLNFLNIEVKIIGTMPKKDKILYAINHRSLLDILVMESVFSKYDKNGAWIAKQDLFDAFYGNFFRYSGCISVDLQNKRGLLKFFKQIKISLSKVPDFNIFMFPEGERFKKDGIGEFQTGASKIAIANKLDVIPVFINDKLEKVLSEAPFKEKRIIEVNIGKKIDVKNLEDEYNIFRNEILNG
jgi:1-acyl-sn-glycerol-3-phosphate acyltransferase